MNLTESQKVIGQENFSDVINVTRRDFLTGTLAAGLATGWPRLALLRLREERGQSASCRNAWYRR